MPGRSLRLLDYHRKYRLTATYTCSIIIATNGRPLTTLARLSSQVPADQVSTLARLSSQVPADRICALARLSSQVMAGRSLRLLDYHRKYRPSATYTCSIITSFFRIFLIFELVPLKK